MAKNWKPLDNTHQAFKRLAVLGPGPRNRDPIKAVGKYECHQFAPLQQMCMIVSGKGVGQTRLIVTDPAWKKKYNKQYSRERKRFAATNNYRSGHVITPPKGRKLKIYEDGQASLSRGRGRRGTGTRRRGRRS